MTRRRVNGKKTEPSKSPPTRDVPEVTKKALEDESVNAPWLGLLSEEEYTTVEARLHDEISAYVEYITETSEERVVVAHVRKLVDDVLRKPFRQCEVRVFGSTDTGLRLPGSDIDLIIDAPDTFDIKDMLKKLSGMLKEKEWCKSLIPILGARVPIISFSTSPQFGSLKFDVGINNFNGLTTGEFVKKHLQSMPTLRPLVFVVKKALAQRDLNDASKSGISSFALICMCIFFLQLNPQGLSQEYLSSPENNKSLGLILQGFLKYYSHQVPFREMYISLSQGRLIRKNTASWITDDCHDCLVIQCPCNPERKITASLSAKNFSKIRSIFDHAHRVIGRSSVSSPGILQTLVSIDLKFIEYRERMGHLVQSGALRGDNVRLESGSSLRVGSHSHSNEAYPPSPPVKRKRRHHRPK